MAGEMRLGEYLLQLVVFPHVRNAFAENREGALEQSGLSGDLQAMLVAGNLDEILNQLYSEYGVPPGDHFPV